MGLELKEIVLDECDYPDGDYPGIYSTSPCGV